MVKWIKNLLLLIKKHLLQKNTEKENEKKQIDDFYQYLIEIYKERDKLLFEAGKGQAELYDKYTFLLSTGAFTISLTLIKDIFPHPILPELLILSWFCFVIAILTSLYSFLSSQEAIEEQNKEIINNIYEIFGIENNEKEKTRNSARRITIWLNKASFLFLSLGFLITFLFSSVNFYYKTSKIGGEKMKEKPKTSKIPQTTPSPKPKGGKLEKKEEGYVPMSVINPPKKPKPKKENK